MRTDGLSNVQAIDLTNYYTFTVTSANATAGATYTNNSKTFTVVTTIASGTTLVCTGTGAPSSSGTLTKASGTGDATITFSANVQGVSAFTISSLNSTTKYMFTFNIQSVSTPGNINLTFNGDSGANYTWSQMFGRSADNGNGTNGSCGNTPCNSTSNYFLLGATVGKLSHSQKGILFFEAENANANYVSFQALASGVANSNSYVYSTWSGGEYTGSGTLSSLTITASAGYLSGKGTLSAIN